MTIAEQLKAARQDVDSVAKAAGFDEKLSLRQEVVIYRLSAALACVPWNGSSCLDELVSPEEAEEFLFSVDGVWPSSVPTTADEGKPAGQGEEGAPGPGGPGPGETKDAACVGAVPATK